MLTCHVGALSEMSDDVIHSISEANTVLFPPPCLFDDCTDYVEELAVVPSWGVGRDPQGPNYLLLG